MSARRGLTLIEVLAALVIVGISATAWAGLMGQSTHAVLLAETREAEVRSASAAMSRISIWPRSELERHLGSSEYDGLRLVVSRPWPSLYDVTLSDTVRAAPILRTCFYKPDAIAR